MRLLLCVFGLCAVSWASYIPGGGGGTPGVPVNAVQFNDPLGTFAGDINNQFITTALGTPSAPIVTPTNPQTSTYGYVCVGLDIVGLSIASMETQTTTGNSTLSGTNPITVDCGTLSGATSFAVYRSTDGPNPDATGFIGITPSGTPLSDQGQVPVGDDSGNIGLTPYSNGLAIGTTLRVRGGPVAFASDSDLAGFGWSGIGFLNLVNSDNNTGAADAFVSKLFYTGTDGASGANFGVTLNGGGNCCDPNVGTAMIGMELSNFNNGAGNVVENRQLSIDSFFSNGTAGMNSAIYIDPQTSGATKEYGIFHILGPSEVGVTLQTDPSQTADVLDLLNSGSSILAAFDANANLTLPSSIYSPNTFLVLNALPLTDGQRYYCSDCTVTSAINASCVSGGTGSAFFRLNGANQCFQ